MTASASWRGDAAGVRLLTRNGYDFAGRFPLAAAAVAALSARSCLIDGEAIVTDQKGLAVFDLIRGRQPSVPLASEDSQIGVRMRVCRYGQDRAHPSCS
jgi:ATP-dependent DNA ligase